MTEWCYWCPTCGWQRTALHCPVCRAYFPSTAPIRLISDRDALAMALELARLLELEDHTTIQWGPNYTWFNCEANWLRAQVIQALREGR